MAIQPPQGLKPHEHSAWYEALSFQDQKQFLKSLNPTLRQFKSVIRSHKELYGDFYWAYELDNGWRYGCSSSKEETVQKLHKFLSYQG